LVDKVIILISHKCFSLLCDICLILFEVFGVLLNFYSKIYSFSEQVTFWDVLWCCEFWLTSNLLRCVMMFWSDFDS